MKNILLFLVIISLILSFFTVFSPFKTITASGETLHVGSGQTYNSIQTAINNANQSDTVYVHSGTYSENILIDKTITLTGEGKTNTIISGTGDQTIEITANTVIVSGFTIENDETTYACVFLNSVDNCEISNCNIKKGGNGIHLLNSNTNTIEDSTIEDNNVGIFFSSSDNNDIKNNYIQDNNAYGVQLYSTANDNTFYLNHFSHEIGSNARDLSSNIWSYNSEGNYWDDYNDYDSNGDGIGDSAYVIDSDSKDNYPLGVFLNMIPVATIADITPSPATQGETVSFYGDWSDDSGTPIQWEWESDKNGVFGYAKNCQNSSLSVGTHTISFRIYDGEQWSEADTETLEIRSQSSQINIPTATIVTIDNNGKEVYFHGIGQDSDGQIQAYQWRSNLDGIISTESSFTKSDLSVGSHTIYFKVQDDDGYWSLEKTQNLVITDHTSSDNQAPVADPGGPYTGVVNSSILFDASDSYDPDSGDIIASYIWDFDDGSTGNGETVEHVYTSEGSYYVTLTITDNRGSESVETTDVTISNDSNNNNETPVNKNVTSKKDNKGFPGFEIILVFLAIFILISFILLRKKIKN